jgi:hypothetical protein
VYGTAVVRRTSDINPPVKLSVPGSMAYETRSLTQNISAAHQTIFTVPAAKFINKMAEEKEEVCPKCFGNCHCTVYCSVLFYEHIKDTNKAILLTSCYNAKNCD